MAQMCILHQSWLQSYGSQFPVKTLILLIADDNQLFRLQTNLVMNLQKLCSEPELAPRLACAKAS